MSTVRATATDLISALMRADVLAAETGHRLVEQQQIGFEGERGRDLERRACGHTAVHTASDVNVRRQPDVGDQRRGTVVEHVQRAFERQKSNEPPRLRWSATRTFSMTVRCGNTADI